MKIQTVECSLVSSRNRVGLLIGRLGRRCTRGRYYIAGFLVVLVPSGRTKHAIEEISSCGGETSSLSTCQLDRC